MGDIVSSQSSEHGGTRGTAFNDSHRIEDWGRITRIVVRSGSKIDALTVYYANNSWTTHGGSGGRPSVISLEKDEYIIKVSGRAGSVIDQLTFFTSKGRTLGPYGGGGGSPFSLDFQGQVLHFFTGRSSKKINRIGCGYGERQPKLPNDIVTTKTHGGGGGSPFDDLPVAVGKIKSITVRHGAVIDQIACNYDIGGHQAHGGNGGGQSTFNLGEDEYITEVRGRAGRLIDSLQFVTNKNRQSPQYGSPTGGSPFTEKEDRRILRAIHGRSGGKLDQLGFYFGKAKPTKVVVLDLTFDLSNAIAQQHAPTTLAEIYLVNNSSTSQTCSHEESSSWSESDETSISQMHGTHASFSVEHTAKAGLLGTGGETKYTFTAGYVYNHTKTVSVTTTTTHSKTFRFVANVAAHSRMRAQAVVIYADMHVPWTATAKVWYEGKSKPKIETLTGSYDGVAAVTQVEYGETEPA